MPPVTTVVKSSCSKPKHHCRDCHDVDIPKAETHKDHKCKDTSCGIETPHGHINPNHEHDSCLSCVRDHLRNIFPIQKSLKHLEISSNQAVNNFAKEVLANVALFTPSLSVSEIGGDILKTISDSPLNAYIVPPLGITAMHAANRGKEHPEKLFLTALTCIGVTALQQLINFPRSLVRAFVAIPLFFIEKIGSPKHHEHKHEHGEKCTKECTHEHKHSDSKNLADLLGLVKLQALINTVPLLVNTGVSKLKEINNQSNSFISRFFGNIGIFVFKILGLSTGFVASGKLITKGFDSLGFKDITNGNITGKVEATACACCGAPVCVVEAATEAASESTAIMLGSEHTHGRLSEALGSLSGAILSGGLLGTILSKAKKAA